VCSSDLGVGGGKWKKKRPAREGASLLFDRQNDENTFVP